MYCKRATPYDLISGWICLIETTNGYFVLQCNCEISCSAFSQRLSKNSWTIANDRRKNIILDVNNVQKIKMKINCKYFVKFHSFTDPQYLSPLQPSFQLYYSTLGCVYLYLTSRAAWIAVMQIQYLFWVNHVKRFTILLSSSIKVNTCGLYRKIGLKSIESLIIASVGLRKSRADNGI